MPPLATEIRHSFRRLIRTPLFTLVALVTLAVGIGANASIFTILSSVLLEPLPYREPDRLVGVWHTADGIGIPVVNLTDAQYFHYRETARSFESFAVMWNTEVNLTGGDRAERVLATRATADFFRVLGVSPAIGRGFTEEDDAPNSTGAVVITDGLWRRRFGADPGVLGQTLRVNGVERPIVGVLPRDFVFGNRTADLFMTAGFDPANVNTGNFNFNGIARLAPGVDMAAATNEVTRLAFEIPDRFAGPIQRSMLEQAQFTGDVHPLMEDVVEDVGSSLWVLFGMVGLVLIVACANVANLFLVRAESRQREVAVRTALGAGRGAIAREFVLESVILSLFGGVAGLGLAWAGMRGLRVLEPQNLPRLMEIGIDGKVVLFTFAISLLAGMFLGVLPSLRYRGLQLVSALKEGGRGGSAGRDRHRAQNSLVVAQLATALVLMVGSGLMLRSFAALRDVYPGFESPETLLTAQLAISEADFPEYERVEVMHHQILDRLRALPGVQSVGLTTSVPLWDNASHTGTWLEGHDVQEGGVPPVLRTLWIGGDYFPTLGIPLLAGRSIEPADMSARARVVVVNEALARQYWGEPQAAVGKRIRQSPVGEWSYVIGVVGNTRSEGLDQDPPPTVFNPLVGISDDANGVPTGIYARRTIFVALRTSGPAMSAAPGLRSAILDLNRNLPLARVQPMTELLARATARTSFLMVMLAIAAGMALFLAAVGIYGVISYVVGQRTREIGVRMALGAESGRVAGMVLGKGLVLAAIGVVVGLVAALGLTRLMSSMLFGVRPVDPVTFAGVAVGLTAVAAIASWLPARRAAKLDPVEALRSE